MGIVVGRVAAMHEASYMYDFIFFLLKNIHTLYLIPGT